jgi:hypothetical protein
VTKKKLPEGKPMPGAPGRSATAPNGSRARKSKAKPEADEAFIEPDLPEQPAPQALKRARIFQIAQLMASGEWRSSMAKDLAREWSDERWKVSVKTVQHYSAEAGRLVDFTTGQRDTLVKMARVRLLQVAHEDETDRVQAIRTLLENLGELRQQHVVTQVDPFEGWSEAELETFADKGERPARFGRRGTNRARMGTDDEHQRLRTPRAAARV